MGSLIQVWPRQQPRPGALGVMDLLVIKDRPGQVRKISLDGTGNGKVQLAATVTLDSRVEGKSVLTIGVPIPLARAATPSALDTAAMEVSERQLKIDAMDQKVEHAMRAFDHKHGVLLSKRDILRSIGILDVLEGVNDLPQQSQVDWDEALNYGSREGRGLKRENPVFLKTGTGANVKYQMAPGYEFRSGSGGENLTDVPFDMTNGEFDPPPAEPPTAEFDLDLSSDVD
jgi:hypothetical protein